MKNALQSIEESIYSFRKLFFCSENTRFYWLTKYMPGIGGVEPYQVASIVIVNKTYARNRFCWQNICQE